MTRKGRTMAFAEDNRLVSIVAPKCIEIWDLKSKRLLNSIPSEHSGIEVIQFSPSGELLAYSSNSYQEAPSRPTNLNFVTVWDRRRKTKKFTFHIGKDIATTISFTPDERALAAGDDKGRIRIWNLKSGRQKNNWKGHADIVLSMAYGPDGKTLATGSLNEIRLWNPRMARQTKLLKVSESVHALAVTPNRLAAVTQDGRTWEWKRPSLGKPIITSSNSTVSGAAITSDGKCWAMLGGGTGPFDSNSSTEASLYIVGYSTPAFTCHGPGMPSRIALSPNHKYLAASSDTGEDLIRIWATRK